PSQCGKGNNRGNEKTVRKRGDLEPDSSRFSLAATRENDKQWKGRAKLSQTESLPDLLDLWGTTVAVL
ncbi:MAG TPA: hypothetical protein VE243_12650, partial [Candidatus Acidoferrum sp.]|nr:hypothetical protein [Candidatus Acidoferrum sp.]